MTTVYSGEGITFNDLSVQSTAAKDVGFKNKIIGGDFTTNPWQRGTSFAAIGNGTYFADRWVNNAVTTGVVTASKAVDAPTAAQAGSFTQHCISLAVTTADTSIAAGDRLSLSQAIEGLNAASFGFGQAGSRNVTLSFWVKGTKTGIHCVSVKNSSFNRAYVAEYTIVATNTWEYKTITIPVDTSGTWLYDNGVGLVLDFALAAGTNFHTTANTWGVATDYRIATANQVNALDSTANVFKIALVQLEAGSVATSFDVRDYGRELALCQRYYEKFGSGGIGRATSAAVGEMGFTWKVEKRALPVIALIYTAAAQILEVTVAERTMTSIIAAFRTSLSCHLEFGVSAGGMTSPNMLGTRPTTDLVGKFLSASSEL